MQAWDWSRNVVYSAPTRRDPQRDPSCSCILLWFDEYGFIYNSHAEWQSPVWVFSCGGKFNKHLRKHPISALFFNICWRDTEMKTVDSFREIRLHLPSGLLHWYAVIRTLLVSQDCQKIFCKSLSFFYCLSKGMGRFLWHATQNAEQRSGSVCQATYYTSYMKGCVYCTLQWRHNERDGVSNHQPHDCLLKRLFKAQIK